ncbi:MAG TPA: cellulase family glycosylhydrolase [Polyangiales bacterium]|nr:cellulase family glycosylhydrolase [Polyangiales bacterium]
MTRRGRELYYDDKPYKSVGINAFGMAGCETGRAYTQTQMDSYFSSLRPRALTRAWAFQAQGIAGVERMVRSAEAHSQFLILSLADGRGYCAEEDGRVADEGSGKRASWYADGYKARYLPWLEMVVTRFKDSPAIALWELVNEPGGDGTTDQAMRRFFDAAAARIKAIDKNHLVMSGSQAEYVAGTGDFAFVHAGPDIDAASLHEYDYDDSNGRIVSQHLRPVLNAMKSLDKPLLITEVGIRAAASGDCRDYSARRNAFKQKFDAYMPQDGVAAVLVWSWVPRQRSGCVYEVSNNDPLMELLSSYP